MEKEKKQPPVHQVRLPFGGCLLRASVWRHQNGEEAPRFNVTFTRTYLEKDGKTWAYSEFFRRDDLLGIARAAELAHDWIIANDGKEAKVDE
jgi:hypothetical protein